MTQSAADPAIETTGETVDEPSKTDETPPAKSVTIGHVVILVLAAILISGIAVYLIASPGNKDEEDEGEKQEQIVAPSPSSSAEAPPKKEEAKKEEADKEEPEDEAEDTAKYQRRCRDDVTIPDCREVTPDQLNKCGFCSQGACSGGSSSVHLVCASQALVDYALSVSQSGKGTVNLCECQEQQAQAVQVPSQPSE